MKNQLISCSAECRDCPWTWVPKETTDIEGPNGSKCCSTAAYYHAKDNGHRTFVTRLISYNFRSEGARRRRAPQRELAL